MKWSKILDKKISFRYFILLTICFMVIAVLFGTVVRHQNLPGVPKYGRLGDWVEKMAEFPMLAKQSIKSIFGSDKIGVIERKANTFNGFKRFYKDFNDSGFILESVFNKDYKQNIIKLVSAKDGETAYQWIPPLLALQLSKKNYAVHPYLCNDGSIIFSIGIDGIALGYLVKIDSLSKLLWSINIVPHHSIELDANKNIWCPITISLPHTINSLTESEIKDEGIAKISPDGKLLSKKSIAEILLKNGFEALFLGVGMQEVGGDVIHLNEIRPALYSSKYWEKGDLLISLRHKSTVFLYRPSNNKIIWLQTGPWMNQHCPDFLDSSKISVFGNDIIRRNEGDYLINGHNNIYVYDFSTNTTSTPYSNMMRDLKVSTPTQGRLKILPNEDVYIDESDSGRIIRANKNGPIWIFENKYDENHIALSNWSRYLVRDGDCKFCLTENVK